MEEVSLRTVQMDLQAMMEDTRLNYCAPIEYDTVQKAYRYTDTTYSIQRFGLREHEIQALKFYAARMQIYSKYGMFSDFSNAIQKIVEGVSIRHALKKETRPELVVQTDTSAHFAGSEFLSIIVQAIEEGFCVEFDYKKYSDVSEKKRIVAPYLLKEYKNRWYILGVELNAGKVQTFALDRISTLILNAKHPKGLVAFDPEHYFKYAFGITTPDKKVKRIVLEFLASQAPYIKSLPIHPTQKIILETTKFLKIEIEVIPSYELYEFILGKTPEVRVISPTGIAKIIKNALETGIKAYRRN